MDILTLAILGLALLTVAAWRRWWALFTVVFATAACLVGSLHGRPGVPEAAFAGSLFTVLPVGYALLWWGMGLLAYSPSSPRSTSRA